MKRTRIRSKELNKELAGAGYTLEFSKKDQVEILEDKEDGLKAVLINNEIQFFYHEDQLLPSLRLLQKDSTLLKKIVVDMGAIKFVVNGADIMRPGITEIDDEINEGDFIIILDIDNQKPLAIGKALFNSEQMKSLDSGKVIENIHFIGDEIWKLNI